MGSSTLQKGRQRRKGIRLLQLIVLSCCVFIEHNQALASDFVERVGDRLSLGGDPFCFLGANAYFLMVDVAQGDTDAVREVFSSAREIGMTVLRRDTTTFIKMMSFVLGTRTILQQSLNA